MMSSTYCAAEDY